MVKILQALVTTNNSKLPKTSNIGEGKLWRFPSNSPKFYPAKNAFRKFYKKCDFIIGV